MKLKGLYILCFLLNFLLAQFSAHALEEEKENEPLSLHKPNSPPLLLPHPLVVCNDMVEHILSLTSAADASSLILVSRSFHQMLMGRGEENNTIWQSWRQQMQLPRTEKQSDRNAIIGHCYLKKVEVKVQEVEKLKDQKGGKRKSRRALKSYRDILMETSPLTLKQQEKRALFLIRKWVDEAFRQGNLKAIEKKMEGYLLGTYGFKKDYKKAFLFNEALLKTGHINALRQKIVGCRRGAYGYRQNYSKAFKLNRSLKEAGDPWALNEGWKDPNCLQTCARYPLPAEINAAVLEVFYKHRILKKESDSL